MKALEIKNLSKKFGNFTAVENTSLSIDQGERYALIGPNGAGKTTLIKLFVGLLLPTAGKAAIYGYDVEREPVTAKKQFGYLPDDPSAYVFLTGAEFLILAGRLRGISQEKLKDRITELVTLFPISEILHQPMSSYSRGNIQKIAFLSCLLGNPRLLIIDEPIVGLDNASIDILGKTLMRYSAQGNTVFFVTHILDFAQKYASRLGIMQKGKIIKETRVNKSINLESLFIRS